MGMAFGRVTCGCGRISWSGRGEVVDLVASADVVVRERMCADCCPRLEIVHTINLPISAPSLKEATEADMRAALRRDPCAYCGAPQEELDHIIPRARGGSDKTSNLTAACSHCNREKLATSLLTYLARRVTA